MKKCMILMLALLLLLAPAQTAYAADGEVSYNGNSRSFIFEPGTTYSVTDLFPDFKDVMPGDSLTQRITVRNDASHKVKVKIYLRSLGAYDVSVDFLSQLHLRVQLAEGQQSTELFDAPADQTAGLTDWVCLGTLYSGGEVDLDVILDVLVELDNEYSDRIGYLEWEFMVEEFPVAQSDPKPPATGDTADLALWSGLILASGMAFCLLAYGRRRVTAR